MKKFVFKLLAFFTACLLLAVVCFLFSFCVIKCQHTQSYMASMYDKIERLKSIDEPKIVLVGNSNLSFGINSPMIEEAFKMPVVNLGLHGGLGNSFHEEMAKLSVNEGDIIIICHSSYEDDKVQPKELWETCEWNASSWDLVKDKDYFSIICALPSYMISNFELWITGAGNKSLGTCYSRDAFNEYGDIVFRPETYSENFALNTVSASGISDSCIERLNELNKFITQKGATMLIAAYPIAYGEYTADRSEFENFQKKLENMVDCPVISDYTDYFFGYEYFYNSNLHLSEEGACLRTRQLIDDLNKYFDRR